MPAWRKCEMTLSAKISCALIACQWANPPGFTVIETSERPSQTSLTASIRSITSLGVATRRVAVLVQVARVDPDDVRLSAALGAPGAVEVELVLERGVGEKRRDDDRPAALRRELIRAIARAPEEDAELPRRPGAEVG